MRVNCIIAGLLNTSVGLNGNDTFAALCRALAEELVRHRQTHANVADRIVLFSTGGETSSFITSYSQMASDLTRGIVTEDIKKLTSPALRLKLASTIGTLGSRSQNRDVVQVMAFLAQPVICSVVGKRGPPFKDLMIAQLELDGLQDIVFNGISGWTRFTRLFLTKQDGVGWMSTHSSEARVLYEGWATPYITELTRLGMEMQNIVELLQSPSEGIIHVLVDLHEDRRVRSLDDPLRYRAVHWNRLNRLLVARGYETSSLSHIKWMDIYELYDTIPATQGENLAISADMVDALLRELQEIIGRGFFSRVKRKVSTCGHLWMVFTCDQDYG